MYDQEPNFEESFGVGDRMVLMGLQYVGSINTRYGNAEKTLITVVTRESYPSRKTYSALGAGFANMARRAERGDFPHVAEYITVDLGGGKAVKRFARVEVDPKEWIDGEDGPPVDVDALTPSRGASEATDDEIPF